LAIELVRRKVLTKFQAKMILTGKGAKLTLGNWILVEKVGGGGMGQVVKAIDRRSGRLAAVKILRADLMGSESVIQRFHQEVDVATRLNHPNIVETYDADEHEGMHYLVMEYVDGRDLAEVLKEHDRLAVAEAVDYVLQAARGLEYAHGMGMVHRDIKPGNLLLDRQGTIRISDMGLARIVDDEAGPMGATIAERLTRKGQVLGTVDYMSPEQANDTSSADHRSDIYSLGCTLYHLVTGLPIYAGDVPMEKVMAHCREEIPSVCAVAPGVPDSLDAVFNKMVAKKAEDRYQSMTDVIAALEACPIADRSEVPSSSDADWFDVDSGGVCGADDATMAGEADQGTERTIVHEPAVAAGADKTIGLPTSPTVAMDGESSERKSAAADESPATPCLRILTGPDAGKTCQLESAKYVLGRHPDCNVAIDSGAASRYHAQIVADGESWLLEDLRSRNGTFLNDERITDEQTLTGGDRIRIGDVELEFHQGRESS
jgi:serine/threonine protein kinase